MNKLMHKYYQQIVKDVNMVVELYNIKVMQPLRLSLWQHIKINGFFRIILKFFLIVLIKIPILWPFLMLTYLWGLLITYFFLPINHWLEQQIQRKQDKTLVWFVEAPYDKILYIVLQIQWWLKTWLGLIHLFHLFLKWWERLPRLIYRFVIRSSHRWDLFKYTFTKRGGTMDIWLYYLGAIRLKITSTLYKYLWTNPKIFVTTWLNPHKYKIFRLIFYKVNRHRIYTWLYSRWLIRYKIIKGLVKYWIFSAAHMGGRRLLLRIRYLYKMIKLRWHIRHVYNHIALKIYKMVYYVSRELIYIWAGITWLAEIILILFCKTLFLFYPVVWLLSKLVYGILCIFNWFFYNIMYSYDSYVIAFIQRCSNTLKILTIQKNLVKRSKSFFASLKLNSFKNEAVAHNSMEVESVAWYVNIRKFFINNGNKVWRLWFGNESILFVNQVKVLNNSISDAKTPISPSNIQTNSDSQNNKLKFKDDDLLTKIWKWCCPPLWLKLPYPKDVSKPKSAMGVPITIDTSLGDKSSKSKI